MTTIDPTVFIVDDDPAVRDSLSLLLGLKGYLTQCFATAEDFLATFRPDRPGCLLLDYRMPGMSGLEAIAALSERGAVLPVVMITAHGDVATARAALKGGAVDFLEKPVDEEELLTAVTRAIERDSVVRRDRDVTGELSARMERLTRREREVLELVAEGRHNREVAAALGISPRTVEVYKARVMEKLQARSVPELVRMLLTVNRTPLQAE